MAPTRAPKGKPASKSSFQSLRGKVYHFIVEKCTLENLYCLFHEFFLDARNSWLIMILLWVVELAVNIMVIRKIPYTEIDWMAYMEEVEGFVNGTMDYADLKGATGPLVYPAGFVYIFTGLYYITESGKNIRTGQYIFAILYMVTLITVFYIYHKTRRIPPYVLFFMCCASYRIHSIFILRLFNDPVTMLFLYMAICCFINDRWSIGCFFYSIAVSVKMNVLLFAPGLLLLLLLKFGIPGTIPRLAICALVQLILALPFLLVNPSSYMIRSFNFGRQFAFRWTVNWRFLPQWIFFSRSLHVGLLVLHITCLLLFVVYVWPRPENGWLSLFKKSFKKVELCANDIVWVLFSSNFIGLCFARSLHTQFYAWYFHTLPFLLWSTNLPSPIRILIIGVLELCWNTYPSTISSSLCLHVCHLVMLAGLFLYKPPKAKSN